MYQPAAPSSWSKCECIKADSLPFTWALTETNNLWEILSLTCPRVGCPDLSVSHNQQRTLKTWDWIWLSVCPKPIWVCSSEGVAFSVSLLIKALSPSSWVFQFVTLGWASNIIQLQPILAFKINQQLETDHKNQNAFFQEWGWAEREQNLGRN